MNKKGFTLIELLVTITIIGLIAGIGINSYTYIIQNSKKKVYKNYETTMKGAAEEYLIDNIPSIGSTTTIFINELVSKSYLTYINNPDDSSDNCSASYVVATRSNNVNIVDVSYQVCLICTSYQSGC